MDLSSCIIFAGDAPFSIAYTNEKAWDGKLEYTTGTGGWVEWNGTDTISASDGIVAMRGTGNTVISDYPSSKRFAITGANVYCYGNIESLLDYKTSAKGDHPVMGEHCFEGLFEYCKTLCKAPDLGATTLSPYCYGGMFSGCTALKQAPALPVTTLAPYCYADMFKDCTSLTTAPELPATTLASNCYLFMFQRCTAITEAPELPATTLAEYCYSSMFDGCTGIKLSTTEADNYTIAYRIPPTGTATGSTESGLYNMFKDTGGTFTGSPSANTTYYMWDYNA